MPKSAYPVRARFETKVDALEFLARAQERPQLDFPINPTALRRWSGKLDIHNREFDICPWSSPNEYYSDSNRDLRFRFEKVVKELSNRATETDRIRLSGLASQNMTLLLDLERLERRLRQETHKKDVARRDIAALTAMLAKVSPLK